MQEESRESKLRGRETDQNSEITVRRKQRGISGIEPQDVLFLVRHCAWLIAHYQVKSDGNTPHERLRGRPHQGQVAEFAEVVHFRDPGKAADMPKLDDRWNLGLWLGKSLAPDEHYVGTSAGVRRRRSIWRRPEKQRWDRKMLIDMNGDRGTRQDITKTNLFKYVE